MSVSEEFIPFPQQALLTVLNQRLQLVELCPTESAALLKPDRTQPKLRPSGLTLDVNMRRFSTIGRIEEEAIWPEAEYRGHRGEVYAGDTASNTARRAAGWTGARADLRAERRGTCRCCKVRDGADRQVHALDAHQGPSCACQPLGKLGA